MIRVVFNPCQIYSPAASARPAFLPPLSDNTVRFVYDDFGNRIKKTTDYGPALPAGGLQTTAETYYLNDGLTVLNEMSATGNVTKTVVKGISQIAEIDATGTITYIHQDVLGSTVLLTDQAANVVAEYEYDPFGNIIGQSETNGKGTNYLFTNQEWDPDFALIRRHSLVVLRPVLQRASQRNLIRVLQVATHGQSPG